MDGSGPASSLWVPTSGGREVARRIRFRPGRRPRLDGVGRFFYPRPRLPLPALDLLVIPFSGTPCRPLPGPFELPKNSPNMSWVVLDSRHVLDDDRDSGKSPKVRREPMSLCAQHQGLADLLELTLIETALPAGPAARQQRLGALALPVSV